MVHYSSCLLIKCEIHLAQEQVHGEQELQPEGLSSVTTSDLCRKKKESLKLLFII